MAGKRRIQSFLGSLFTKKEQAPSFPAATAARLEKAVQKWIDSRAYLLPDRTLTESARRVGTTPDLLHRYCLEVKGVDFRTFRSSLRIKEAQRLLTEFPELPASTIARRVGIADRSNFSRQFKSVTGLTPTEWREKNR